MRGRPKKPDGDTRKFLFQIRVTAEEREAIAQAAAAKSLDASAWARSELLSLAKKINGAKSPVAKSRGSE